MQRSARKSRTIKVVVPPASARRKTAKTRVAKAPSTPSLLQTSPNTMVAASTAISTQSRTQVQFLSGDFTGSCRIRVHIPLVGLCCLDSPGVGGNQTPGFFAYAAASSSFAYTPMATILLNPVQGFALRESSTTYETQKCIWDCPLMNLIATCFTRYRCMTDMVLSYSPIGSTSSTVAFTIAYTQDPYHPILGDRAYSNALYPVYSTLLYAPNAVRFASWMPWTKAFVTDKVTKYFMYNTSPGGATPNALERFGYFGALSCQTNSYSPSGDIENFGELYVSMDFEFTDPIAIKGNNPIPVLLSGGFVPGIQPENKASSSSLSSKSKETKADGVHDSKESKDPLPPSSSIAGMETGRQRSDSEDVDREYTQVRSPSSSSSRAPLPSAIPTPTSQITRKEPPYGQLPRKPVM